MNCELDYRKQIVLKIVVGLNNISLKSEIKIKWFVKNKCKCGK